MTSNSEVEKIAALKLVQSALEKLDENLPADLKAQVLAAIVLNMDEKRDNVLRIRALLTQALAEKDAAFKDGSVFRKRVLSAVKGQFGDDSLAYESVGGKRLSEIKRSKRPKT